MCREISLLYIYIILLIRYFTNLWMGWTNFTEQDWTYIAREVARKLQNLPFLNKRERILDFLHANEIAKSGQKVRRKSWLPGGKSAWHGKLVYVWWDSKYKCLLAAGPYVPIGDQPKFKDTEGYPYVCEGDDIEGTDWEKADVC